MPDGSTRTIERFRLAQRHVDQRIDKFEELTIRSFLVQIVRFVANRISFAALHPVIVIIENFLEGTAVNGRLIAFETFALFSLKRLDRYGTKFNSLNRAPWIGVAFENLDAIEACPKPVIAAVLGYAIGGGQELCLACDLRVAGESATFGQVEVNIGSIPSWGGTQRLARTVGVAYAKDLIYTGRLLTAREAFERGLVSRLVRDDQVMEEAHRLAESIAKRAPLAVAASKSSVSRAFDNDLAANLAHDVDLFSTLYSSEDLHEGLQAFLEKRAPRFKGR